MKQSIFKSAALAFALLLTPPLYAALDTMQIAAEQGDVLAQYNLGV